MSYHEPDSATKFCFPVGLVGLIGKIGLIGLIGKIGFLDGFVPGNVALPCIPVIDGHASQPLPFVRLGSLQPALSGAASRF